MGRCPECGDEIERLRRSTTVARAMDSTATVWECPHCHVIVGTSALDGAVPSDTDETHSTDDSRPA